MNNGLDLMQARLKVRGGVAQQDRMIKDKRESLDRALLYSYQGAKVRKLDSEKTDLALINPNTVKQDYDDKVISIGFEYNYAPGTVFEWVNTGTKWLIYLQDLTELAYFRGDIRKCNYEIKWNDKDGNIQSTYVALRGPTETKFNTSIKEGISFDFPNYSLHILMPKNEETLKYFTRYSKFYLQGGDAPTCWRVEAIDSISMPGILEVSAMEYYANEYEDNLQEGIVGDLIVEPIPPEPTTAEIIGEVFIKPKLTYEYEYTGSTEGEWNWNRKLPLKVEVNGKKIQLKWETTYTGQFILSFGEIEKTIVVESLF